MDPATNTLSQTSNPAQPNPAAAPAAPSPAAPAPTSPATTLGEPTKAGQASGLPAGQKPSPQPSPAGGEGAGAPAAPPPGPRSGVWAQLTDEQFAAIPEELRAAKSLEQYQTLPDLIKGFIETKAKVGAKGVIVPGKDATAEQRAAFFAAIGRPEKPDGYQPPVPGEATGLPDGYALPEADQQRLQALAHELGLSRHQGESLMTEYARTHAAALEQQSKQAEQRRTQSMAALRADWGVEADTRIEEAKLMVRELGGDELVEALNRTGLGDEPALVKALYKAADLARDDQGLVGSGPARANTAPIEARAQIAEMKADHELMARMRGGDRVLSEKWQKLHEIAAGQGSAARGRM